MGVSGKMVLHCHLDIWVPIIRTILMHFVMRSFSLQVSKPYASYFSEDNLKSMLVERVHPMLIEIEQRLDMMENDAMYSGNPTEGIQEGNLDDDNMDVDAEAGFDED